MLLPNMIKTEGQRNAAFGMDPEDLDIVVIDPSRTMQTLIRSMILPMRPRRLRFHENVPDALQAMMLEPPTLVFSEWHMRPMSGNRLLKIMRNRKIDTLCFVPVIVVTGDATRRNVETALRAGAQAVLAKPVSSTDFRKRIDFVLSDERPFEPVGDQFVVSGVAALLDKRRERDRLPALLTSVGLEPEPPMRAKPIESASLTDMKPSLLDIRRRNARRLETAIKPAPSKVPVQTAPSQKTSGKSSRWSQIWHP
jgi:two-component system, OmpR family, phosphate regulon response regulator PhoB